jgi:sec-independent protein translocase protein TatA
MGFGPWEVVIVLVILVIIFGAGRLTQVSGAVGKGVREFRSAVQDEPKPATPVVTTPPVICAACQTANVATNKFCSSCGVSLASPEPAATTLVGPMPVAAAEITCPSCATVNPAGQVFCGQCGTRLTLAA